jgi:hypothetical protein
MSLQHSTDRREAKGEARGSTEQEVIVVPLEWGALRILKQDLQGDGSIGVEVIATTDRARYSATRTPHRAAGNFHAYYREHSDSYQAVQALKRQGRARVNIQHL